MAMLQLLDGGLGQLAPTAAAAAQQGHKLRQHLASGSYLLPTATTGAATLQVCSAEGGEKPRKNMVQVCSAQGGKKPRKDTLQLQKRSGTQARQRQRLQHEVLMARPAAGGSASVPPTLL